MNFQDSETEPKKWGTGGSSCPLGFQKKYPFVTQNRTISTNFHTFLLQSQRFRVSGRPEFPNFGLQAFSFHCLYQEDIIICEAK